MEIHFLKIQKSLEFIHMFAVKLVQLSSSMTVHLHANNIKEKQQEFI
jgi:hypothetical protein